MDATYSFETEPEIGLMTIRMGGFFDTADIQRFVAAVGAAFATMPRSERGHVTMVDIREMSIQSQQSVGGFQHLLSDNPNMSKRIAFVVAKSLARLQIKRAADGRNAGYYESEREAREWLLRGD